MRISDWSSDVCSSDLPDGERTDLPRPSIDTGLGLERVAAVLQGVHDNYDTDPFKPLIAASVEQTGVPADEAHKASHRVIAAHIASASFLIAAGVLPPHPGRGFVRWRIIRRAMSPTHLIRPKHPVHCTRR